jgi:DNA-binding MarR family transcriptional regulator
VTESSLLETLADAAEAFAATLRQHANPISPQQAVPTGNTPEDVVARARIIHPLLGKRQAEIIGLLAQEHPNTTNTGKLSRAMNYDQPNVYLTLQGLIQANLAVKDATKHPHQYGLSPNLFDPEIFDL